MSTPDPASVRRGPAVTRGNQGSDAIDRLLLALLARDGRATFAELGRAVGLTAPAVHERVSKLEAAGLVTGYHAAITPSALGLGVAALVGVFTTEASEQDEVAERLRQVDAVEDCWVVAGEETFVVKVRAPDVDALEATLGVLRRIPGVARTRTTVVLSTRWEGRTPLPEAAPPPPQPPAG